MDPSDFEALKLTFEKDALLVEYETRANRWNALQAAALAVLGLAVLGFLQGVLALAHLAASLIVVIGFLIAAGRVLRGYDDTLRNRMFRLISRIERLKRTR